MQSRCLKLLSSTAFAHLVARGVARAATKTIVALEPALPHPLQPEAAAALVMVVYISAAVSVEPAMQGRQYGGAGRPQRHARFG